MPNELKRIRIGAIDYDVREVISLRNDDDERLDGQIDYVECVIRTVVSCSEQMRRVILWHEILHGILTQAGIEEQPEALIDVIAYGVTQVLRDNPVLGEAVMLERWIDEMIERGRDVVFTDGG